MGARGQKKGRVTTPPLGKSLLPLALLSLTQATPASPPVQPLPGGLDRLEMANSNHPEGVQGPGVALSTLRPPGGCPQPGTHLGHDFQGDFRIFAHHKNISGRPLYQVIALFNPLSQPVSYALGAWAVTTTSEAPYQDPPGSSVTPLESAHLSGPGEATAARVLQGAPDSPREAAPGLTMLSVKPVAPGEEVSSLMELSSQGPLEAAVVFLDSPPQAPQMWEALHQGTRVPGDPHSPPPSPPGTPPEHFIYGRVAGIQQGTTWKGTLEAALGPGSWQREFALDTKATNTLGTGQEQAAPLIARYPDSAYRAHGNYGVDYDLSLPVSNRDLVPRKARVSLVSPSDPHGGLRSFRGVVSVEDQGPPRFLAVNETEGSQAPPLWEAVLQPGEQRHLKIRLVYPADDTPPQILRVSSPPAEGEPPSP